MNNNVDQNQTKNQSVKKKKYWLIPIYVFLVAVLAPVINVALRLLGIESTIISTIATMIYVIGGFTFIPSIIVAIVLGSKNK